jgi:hypothetical protein
VIGLAAAAAVALAADPGFDRVTERAKACILANAADVERAEPSLADAATFLLDDVCAVPVTVREQYGWSRTVKANMQRPSPTPYYDDEDGSPTPAVRAKMQAAAAKQRDAYARATISEETGDIVLPEGADAGTNLIITSGAARQAAGPELRAFAAKTLLDARKARQTR